MPSEAWWRHGVFYEIYPRSFQDTDGDGIGDLAGIRRRLPYLRDLGVDAIWIAPFFPSPMADFGYDVADYCDVDPRFGTLADFDALIVHAKAIGVRVVVDFVPNHTSDQHPWFVESRRSCTDAKRDWYLWRDPAPEGGLPTNWLSNFGGPAWTFDEATGQYYGHMFLKEQPDLNWRNAEMREAMFDVMRFWLKRGVDGFRVDVVYHLIKDDEWRDNPPNPAYVPGTDPSHRLLQEYTTDRPGVQSVVLAMRRVLDEFATPQSSPVLICEVYLPVQRLMNYYGMDAAGVLRGAQLPFNFHLIGAVWQAHAIDRLVRDYEAALPPGAAPNWVLGNHDKPRIASRVGASAARLAAMLLLTLRGTPTLYYGDELGMSDVPIPIGEVQDPFERRQPGHGLGRDPQRTPMPWEADRPLAGFTTGRPWLRLGGDASAIAVDRQLAAPDSMLQLYRRLLRLRRACPALNDGAWEPVGVQGNVLLYARESADECVVVVLNFGPIEVQVDLGDALPAAPPPWRIWLSTLLDRDDAVTGGFTLRAEEGVVIGSGAAPAETER
ncbi:MAG: alpha-amylase family glycosyl hydrolase [Caldimonas sp.]